MRTSLPHLDKYIPFPDASEFANLSITAFFTSKEISSLQSLLLLLFLIYMGKISLSRSMLSRITVGFNIVPYIQSIIDFFFLRYISAMLEFPLRGLLLVVVSHPICASIHSSSFLAHALTCE